MTTNLTRLTDSGFILKSDGTSVAFDVGEYCAPALLAGRVLAAAVFSHMHGDHCDVTKLPSTLITIAGPSDLKDQLVGSGASEYITLTPGTPINVHGFTVEAVIVDHGNITKPIENYGLVIITPAGERVWFAGDIRVDSKTRPEGSFDLVIVPVGGKYVFNAEEAFAYVHEFPGKFMALGVHYDYAPEEAITFTNKVSSRVKPVILSPGAKLMFGGS